MQAIRHPLAPGKNHKKLFFLIPETINYVKVFTAFDPFSKHFLWGLIVCKKMILIFIKNQGHGRRSELIRTFGPMD